MTTARTDRGGGAPAEQAAALLPVREALLAAARAEADAVLARGRRRDAELLAAARAEAGAIRAEAERRGTAEGAAAVAALRRRSRRTARTRVLAARQDAYLELCRQVGLRVGALREDAGYPQLRGRLAARARQLLGPGAVLGEPASGGVLAEAPGRRADLGLEALAAHAVALLGPEVQRLWAP